MFNKPPRSGFHFFRRVNTKSRSFFVSSMYLCERDDAQRCIPDIQIQCFSTSTIRISSFTEPLNAAFNKFGSIFVGFPFFFELNKCQDRKRGNIVHPKPAAIAENVSFEPFNECCNYLRSSCRVQFN